MAFNNTNMLRIAQIGAMTRPEFRNMPTLDLGGAVDNFFDARDAADKRAERQAYIDALTEQHPEDAARIAADPLGYVAMLDENKKAERDYNYRVALQDLENKNKIGLAKLAAQLKGGDADITNAIKNVAAMVRSGIPEQDAWKLYYGGQNSTLDVSQLGQKGQEAYDKKMGEMLGDEAVAQRQLQTLQPKAENALKRAKESLQSGYGLGQIGGIGWTNEQGGINRGNIKSAQTQINTTMRGLLKQLGVGSTELNSAAEAEAYRYMLSPDMPIGQQAQVIKNFEEDYLSGALAEDLAKIYGNKNKEPIDWSKVSNEDILKGL